MIAVNLVSLGPACHALMRVLFFQEKRTYCHPRAIAKDLRFFPPKAVPLYTAGTARQADTALRSVYNPDLSGNDSLNTCIFIVFLFEKI